MNQRAIAAKIIQSVCQDGRSLTTLLFEKLTEKDNKTKSTSDPLIQEMCYGTLRFYFRLAHIANHLLDTPIKAKNADIFALLLVGLYQLAYMNIPDYAVVFETVAAAKHLKKSWATALLNKTLRRYLTEQSSINQAIDNQARAEVRYAHPQWFIEQLQAAWPEQWESILQANNERPPMFVRVNLQHNTRANYQQQLSKHNIANEPVEEIPTALQLKNPLPVNELPGFYDGLCSVQDCSGQNVIPLLDLEPKHSVLDACAAPGSKTSHILEAQPHLSHLVAVDKDVERLAKIKENIDRLKLSHHHLRLVLADVTHHDQWWDGKPFDRILIDAPCSGTGVIRRHPDIKLLRQPKDIETLAQQQYHLLRMLWPLLKGNGKLVYTTCSILPHENESVITHFCKQHKNAKTLPVDTTLGIKLKHGLQVLPHTNGPDGFYYAVLVKKH